MRVGIRETLARVRPIPVAAAVAGLALVVSLVSYASCKGSGKKPGPPPKASSGAARVAAKKAARAHWFADDLDVSTFQKGNIHTHSTNSDGKASPRQVYEWYRDHGYAFLAMTDHNTLTEPSRFRSLERKNFILIPGEELTLHGGGAPVHVNSLCTHTQMGNGYRGKMQPFASVKAALGWAVSKIHNGGGIALVNHPNYQWAFTADELPAAKGAELLEIWNGHPHVHPDGDDRHPSEEAIWDVATSRGQTFGAVSVDDEHFLSTDPSVPGPGRGWVQVFSNELTGAAICEALGKARLYASNGAELKRIQIARGTFSVWPAESGARVDFIAMGGKVVSTQQPAANTAAVYQVNGTEHVVRARITSSRGRAWTQNYVVAH